MTGEGLDRLLQRLREELDRLPREPDGDVDQEEREVVVTLKERRR